MKKQVIYIVAAVAVALTVPLLAGADWTTSDYVVAGTLVFITGLGISLAAQKFRDTNKRVLAIIGIVTLALYVWAELAVGVFTSIGS